MSKARCLFSCSSLKGLESTATNKARQVAQRWATSLPTTMGLLLGTNQAKQWEACKGEGGSPPVPASQMCSVGGHKAHMSLTDWMIEEMERRMATPPAPGNEHPTQCVWPASARASARASVFLKVPRLSKATQCLSHMRWCRR